MVVFIFSATINGLESRSSGTELEAAATALTSRRARLDSGDCIYHRFEVFRRGTAAPPTFAYTMVLDKVGDTAPTLRD